MLSVVGTSEGPEFEAACRLRGLILDSWPDVQADGAVRIERITAASVPEDWLGMLGTQQIIFRGRGGTGKTMILLRLAWMAYESKGARVLVLTYNRALVADLRRLFTLMGVPTGELRTIRIQTVHSFVHSLLTTWGIIDANDPSFLERFDDLKRETMEYFEAGVLNGQDIQRLVLEDPENFGWDYVFVDEAQDWPEEERDLLREIYGHMRMVLADGVDQLIRRESSCDWRTGIPQDETRTISLKKCLRMKASLARFFNALAQELGLAWHATPYEEIPGGRIIVIEGDYSRARSVHSRLMAENVEAGNDPIDVLVCAPPTPQMCHFDGPSGLPHALSQPAALLRSWGHGVWDGVSEGVRMCYPTSSDQVRVVHYESCRGLEGRMVINLGLDDFYDHLILLRASCDPEETALFAARWLMIPMTRAIDTLVIQINRTESPVGRALRNIAQTYGDFVQWVVV